MSERELRFGPAKYREEEPTETAAKLLDLQRIAEKMISLDDRFDVFDEGKQDPPSLAWSDDSPDGKVRVYAFSKYSRRRGQEKRTESLVVGYIRTSGETREIEFSASENKEAETTLIKEDPNVSQEVDDIHDAFKEVYGYDDSRPMSLL